MKAYRQTAPGGVELAVMDRLQFKSALIVEDEPFIAMDIEQVLGDMGFRDVTMVGSQEEAHAWLETHTPRCGDHRCNSA